MVAVKCNLELLASKGVTIANFPELFRELNSKEQNRIKSVIRKHPDHLKWIDGRANFPLRAFLEAYNQVNALAVLKEARFCAKGVCSNFRVKLPFELNEELAYFLGVLAGDGYLKEPKAHQRGGWTVEMCEDDYDFQVGVYRPIVERLFGCTPKLYLNKRKYGRNNLYSRINSMIMVFYLTRALGMISGSKAHVVETPSFIYKNKDLRLTLAFISGLFDTDGTVTSGRVKFSTVSKRLFHQIKRILSKADIHHSSNIWLKNNRSRLLYTVRISNRSLEKFNKLIGFRNNRKKIRLEKLLAPSSSGQETTDDDS